LIANLASGDGTIGAFNGDDLVAAILEKDKRFLIYSDQRLQELQNEWDHHLEVRHSGIFLRASELLTEAERRMRIYVEERINVLELEREQILAKRRDLGV
jgi:hypothetical protein